jgi:hypothetical protein
LAHPEVAAAKARTATATANENCLIRDNDA